MISQHFSRAWVCGVDQSFLKGEGDKKAGASEDEDLPSTHHQYLTTDDSWKHLFVVSGFGSLILKWTGSIQGMLHLPKLSPAGFFFFFKIFNLIKCK